LIGFAFGFISRFASDKPLGVSLNDSVPHSANVWLYGWMHEITSLLDILMDEVSCFSCVSTIVLASAALVEPVFVGDDAGPFLALASMLLLRELREVDTSVTATVSGHEAVLTCGSTGLDSSILVYVVGPY